MRVKKGEILRRTKEWAATQPNRIFYKSDLIDWLMEVGLAENKLQADRAIAGRLSTMPGVFTRLTRGKYLFCDGISIYETTPSDQHILESLARIERRLEEIFR